MWKSSGQVNRLRWMIKAQQLQVGQEQASNLIKEVSDKTKSVPHTTPNEHTLLLKTTGL